MNNRGIKVVIDTKGKFLIEKNKVAGFNPLNQTIYLKKNPTYLAALHESFHAEQYFSMTPSEYSLLSILEKEEYVYNHIMNSDIFTDAEKYSAQRYIFSIRNNGVWPTSDWKGYD